MKYIFIFLFGVGCLGFAKAQTEGFNIAVKAAPSINWFWGGNSGIIKTNGNIIRCSVGIELTRQYKNIGLQSGLLFETSGGRIKYNNYGSLLFNNHVTGNSSNIEYVYNEPENKIMLINSNAYSNFIDGKDKDLKLCRLNSREYNIFYLTIPLLVIFKEKLPFNFNGSAGINSSFLINGLANDNVTNIELLPAHHNLAFGETKELKNINIRKDVNLYLFRLNLGVSKAKKISDNLIFAFGLNYLISLSKPLPTYSTELQYVKYDTSLPYNQDMYDHLVQKLNISSIELNLELVW